MIGKLFWKFSFIFTLLLWCYASVSPIKDRPFSSYIESQATSNFEEFNSLLEVGNARVNSGKSPTLFIALRDLGREQNINYAKFFPEINLKDIPNRNKRNSILLKYLLSEAQSNLRLGLDLKGGVGFTLKLDKGSNQGISRFEQTEQLKDAVEIMGGRLDGMGVAEPIIRPVGDDAIEIQIAGLSTKDNPEVIDALKKPARLEFKQVHPSLIPETTAKEDYPVGYEVLNEEIEDRRSGEVYELARFVKRIPEATGDIIKTAFVSQTQTGGFQINLEMTEEGAKRFRVVTEKLVNKPLAIVLDGKLYSAPTINEPLSKNAQISGSFSQREAIDLANVLNNPLSVELVVDEMFEVGPTLAEDTRNSSIKAVQLGSLLVIGFMILYYFFGGVIAVLSAVTNVILVLGILASLGATLTLPGVAALVLTLGMGVDANILILERIREERLLGKSPESSLTNGFNKVISTILDANVTTLITAIILFWLGTGPVKGFGLTMAIGIVTSVFCALFVTRTLAELLVHKLKVNQLLGLNLLPKQKIDFFKFRKPAFLVSWVIVIVGVSSVWVQKDSILGIDFTGGDEMTISYVEKIPTQELLKTEDLGSAGEFNLVYQKLIGEDKEVLKIQTRFDQSRDVLGILQSAFPQANFSEVGVNQIGASVSQGIQMNALISVLCALVGILLYVAFRFEIGYGVGAVVATVHDVLMTIGLFVLLGSLDLFVSGQFTGPMLAAILMIVGYSINDTIVVFDRIREELEMNPGMNLKAIINLAINSVFARSILTSITTLLAAVSLYIFGAGIITDFSFVFIVGILTGTFSSIFIASPIFYYWHKGDRRLVEASEHKPRAYDWDEKES